MDNELEISRADQRPGFAPWLVVSDNYISVCLNQTLALKIKAVRSTKTSEETVNARLKTPLARPSTAALSKCRTGSRHVQLLLVSLLIAWMYLG